MHAVSSVQGQGSRQRDERASKTRLLACIRLREHARKATRRALCLRHKSRA